MEDKVAADAEDWNNILAVARNDNSPSQGQAQVFAAKKQVDAILALSKSINVLQDEMGKRVDKLNSQLSESNVASDKVARKTFWLTIALVFATIVQAVAAVAIIFKP